MCATFCTFCKKSASKLVTHHLCECCLVQCCKADSQNQWVNLSKTIISDKATDEKIECEICLEKYPKDELDNHQEICTARLVFQCSVCEGDYVNKEGLFNHLDQHDIDDESKELYYQEMRVTYKVHKCQLCNDQRGYQESIYWRHVHEDHDGFFLRCLDCAANFRSEKRKAEHVCSHCNVGERTVSHLAKLESMMPSELEAPLPEHSEANETTSNVSTGKRCTYCDKYFYDEILLARHIEFHHWPLINKISVTASDNRSQIFHQEFQDGKPQKPIEQRPPVALKKQAFNSFTTIQSKKQLLDTGSVKCSYCSKEYRSKKLANRHIYYSHKPTLCTICNKTFQGQYTWYYHKLKSHTEPQFRCTDCQTLFHQKCVYMRHVRMHRQKPEIRVETNFQ